MRDLAICSLQRIGATALEMQGTSLIRAENPKHTSMEHNEKADADADDSNACIALMRVVRNPTWIFVSPWFLDSSITSRQVRWFSCCLSFRGMWESVN